MERLVLDHEVSESLFHELILLERKKSQGEKVLITNSLRELAERFDVPFHSVKNRYYNSVKDNPEKFEYFTQQEGEKVEATVSTQNNQPTLLSIVNANNGIINNLRTPELRPNRPPYKTGQLLECRVAKVLDRVGAICTTTDGYEYQGLIHISNIKDGYVTDVHEYFYEGDIVNAKYVKTNERGELELSTKGLKLTPPTRLEDDFYLKANPPINPLAEKLYTVKEKLQKETPTLKQPSNEEEKIMKYLNGIVGAISPAAKEELFNVIEDHGLFAWTLSMSEVAKGFENDLGLLFVNQVRRKLEDDGL